MKVSYIPISLYIHTPWCIHKCPYCDFNSHAIKDDFPEKNYIDALLNDFESQRPLIQGREIQTIFIGGGTPSLFKPESYIRLLEQLQTRVAFSKNIEITLEANPGTFEQSRFQGYRAAGINRLSIGVQSFQDKKLKILQRIHNANEAIHAITSAKKAGFNNLNIDLMFGLPEQDLEDGLYDLQTALHLNPTHLSWYELTLEPHTAFFHHPPKRPDSETLWELQTAGKKLLEKNGYQHYEVSAYANPDYQCQHNRNYWEYGDYLGIGAGAHGKITDFKNQIILRRWNHKNPKDYLNPNKSKLKKQEIIAPQNRPLEFMMNALRLQEVIPVSLFETRTGLALKDIINPLKSAEDLELLRWDKKHIALTQTGHHYLNELLALF